ncbi:uncharacterized protein [Drosophila takahashii]|uniref:uncharacterized protein n=1 Tax=Drosophila takahashii TaxID=29030 RepID=UPI001CF83F97|nr:uncharacterized protein LOC108068280 [Drosophila takahashii]
MFGGSLRNYCLLLPPALQLLNFPPQQQPEEEVPRPLVRFEYPSGHQLRLVPRRLRARRAVPDGDASRPQESGNGPNLDVIFMRRCYLMAGLFSTTTAIMAMILSKAIPLGIDLVMPGFICAMVSLLVLFLLSIGTKCRKFYWFSFILAGLFVSLSGMGVILVIWHRNLVYVCIALLAASTVILIFYFAGAWLPKVVLPGEAAILLLIVVFVVASLFVMTMFIFTDKLIYQVVYFFLLAIMLVPTSLYNAQVVHGRRFKLPVYEFVICAVNVYLHFLLFFTAFYYIIWTPIW